MASAENSVQITVSFSGKEQVLPLSVRPSLELNDHKVIAAEVQLNEALRRAFSLNSSAKLYLHETMTGQILSKESFRDPGYCSNFPRHWYLVVEREEFANINGKGVDEFVNDGRVFDEGGGREASEVEEMAKMFQLGEVGLPGGVETEDYQDSTGIKVMNGPHYEDEFDLNGYVFPGDELLDRDDVVLPSLADLSPTSDSRYQSHTLQCDPNGLFGFTLRHFSIQPNAGTRSDTPQSDHTHSRSDSIASSDSMDSFRLTTTFIYHITSGGVAEGVGMEVGFAIQQINGESILRSSGEEIQQLLEQCGEVLDLLVLPKENDDLQCLYPNYTYGEAGNHMTDDGLMSIVDIPVTRGTGEARDHTPLVPNNQVTNHLGQPPKQMVPPTGLVPFDDGSQELSLGPDNLQMNSLSEDLELLSLHDMIEASSRSEGRSASYSINGHHNSRVGGRENSATGGGRRAGKEGLEFTPTNLDLINKGAPANQFDNNKWYNDSDDQYGGSLPHSLVQEVPGKLEDIQSSMSDSNFATSSPPVELRPRTRSQSSLQKASMSTCSSETHFLSGGRTGLTSSMTALDHLSLGKRSHSTDLGNIRIKRKGRNSLEALTMIGGNLQHVGSVSSSAIKRHRSDENTRRVKPVTQRSVVGHQPDKRDELDRPAWMHGHQLPNRTSSQVQVQCSEGSGYGTQLSGSDHHGSAPRLAHSVSTEGKGRRAKRSYQSQRAKLHSSRSALKISQDLGDTLEHRPSRSRRSVDRSDTSLEGSASQDRSIQSDETLVENRPTNINPAQPAIPIVQVEQQSREEQFDAAPTKGTASLNRHRSMKEAVENSPILREGGKKNRPLSAVEGQQFRHAALPPDGSTHNNMTSSSSSNQFGREYDPKIPLYKTRSAQTPYGIQQVREVNIEEAIARSQMTQEGTEVEGRRSTFEPVKNDFLSSKSRRTEFGKKTAKSIDAADVEARSIGASPMVLRLSTEVLNTLGMGESSEQFRKDINCHGFLNKKLDLTESGKRAADRSWKAHYAVLAGNKLLFYKDKRDAILHKPSEEPPIEVVPSTTTVESNSKKKFVFRVVTAQGAEYLLQADDSPSLSRWVTTIQTLNGGQAMPNELLRGTLQRSEPSNKLVAPSSPQLQRRSSSPQPPKTRRKVIMNRIRRAFTGQRPGDEPDSSSFVTFGQSLEECPVSADNKRVPLVVEFCVREVEQHGLEVEGIYRKPGQVNLIKSMSVEMDKGNYEFSEYGDIHTVGSLLKKFFKELPDPAVPVSLYDEFVSCAKETNEEERLSMLKDLVYRLPTAHYHTVKFLMKHLKKVAAHSDQNKMNYRNVSIVFGPTLLFKPDSSQDVLSNMNASYTVVQLLCQHVDHLFSAELCDEEQRIQEEATEQMRQREEERATRGSPSMARHTETKMQKDERLAKASPQFIRRIRNNLGSSERVSNGKLQVADGPKRNSYSIDSNVSLQPKQPNWTSQPRSPTRRVSEEISGTGVGRGMVGVANPRQQERQPRPRRPHVYEDVDYAENVPVMPALMTDSHARTRSWVENHNERLWATEDVQRSDSAEGHHRGVEMTGSLWASKNREMQQPRGGVKERRQHPRMTRLGRSAFPPPPMTVESDVLGSFHPSSRTASLPNTHLTAIGGIPSSRRIVPSGTTISGHQPRSKRISYGMAVGVSPVDLPDKDIPMRDTSHSRREVDRSERLSSSDHYASRMRAHPREDTWQTEGYSGSRGHTHQGHAHGMYTQQFNSLQRQVSPPHHQGHHYQSSRRSSDSGGDGYSGPYLLQDSAREHYSRYSGGSHGNPRGGRIVSQRAYSSDMPHQRIEGVGAAPIPNRESFL